MKTLHLFAGGGGGMYADAILGHTPICAVEIDSYACEILRQQKEEWWSECEVWEGDIRQFPAQDWKGRVDCVHAGFPCQDISVAGTGKGLHGERSGLWLEVVRSVCAIRPRYVFLENSPAITFRGLERVLGDLASLGFDAEWCVLPASYVGAPHIRARWWCLAYTDSKRLERSPRQLEVNGQMLRHELPAETGLPVCEDVWNESILPALGLADGVATDKDRIRVIGNGQVPLCAAVAFSWLSQRIEREEKS